MHAPAPTAAWACLDGARIHGRALPHALETLAARLPRACAPCPVSVTSTSMPSPA